MKKIILLLSLFSLSVVLSGADITTLDGTVYKNAEVLNTMPDGILVNYVGGTGFNTVKLLKFNNLPVSIQKKYGYNIKKATKFEKKHQKWLYKQRALMLEKEKKAEEAAKVRREKLIAQEKAQTKLDNTFENKKSDNTSTKGESQKDKLKGLINSLGNMSDNKGKTEDKGQSSMGNIAKEAMSGIESKL